MQSPAERHNHILKTLRQRGFVTVQDLQQELNVSEATVRRDLRSLEDRDLLHRTHGGANPQSHLLYDRPISEKAKRYSEEKRRIGRAAAELIEKNDSVILASGTTILEVSRHISHNATITAVTSCVHTALELVDRPGVELIQLGGMVRATSTSVVGASAATMMNAMSCRKLFLGVDGLDIHYGLSTSSPREAHLNQCMITAAQEVIVVTDHSKLGVRGFSKICATDRIDKIITDDQAPKETVRLLEDSGIEVICV